MSDITYSTGWIKDENNEKFAPITTSGQVLTPDGSTLTKKLEGIQAELDGIENPIIDVFSLPETDIVENAWYRILTPINIYNKYERTVDIVHVVDGLPETGESFNKNYPDRIIYFNLQDETVYGYVEGELASDNEIDEGWYNIEYLVTITKVNHTEDEEDVAGWGGLITSIDQATEANTFYLLLKYSLYTYKEGVWTKLEMIGRPGGNINSETFNHPGNVASGVCSHAEGASTTASGNMSHSEGNYTIASGKGAHSEGYKSEASGSLSHTEGFGTIAIGGVQHVEGAYNIPDNELPDDPSENDIRGRYVHIVGNGTNATEEGIVRSNAHTLDWKGNAWYQGDVYTGGTSQDDESAKKLASEEFVSDRTLNYYKVNATWTNTETTQGEGFQLTADKTYAEIMQAISDGYTPIVCITNLGGNILNLGYNGTDVDGTVAVFSCTTITLSNEYDWVVVKIYNKDGDYYSNQEDSFNLIIEVDKSLDETSERPVQNKVIAAKIAELEASIGSGGSSSGGSSNNTSTDNSKYFTTIQEPNINESNTLTWDGDTTGLPYVEVDTGIYYYKVSDVILDSTNVVGNVSITANKDGTENTALVEVDTSTINGVISINNDYVVSIDETGLTNENVGTLFATTGTGIYFLYDTNSNIKVTSLTVSDGLPFTTTSYEEQTKLDPAYLSVTNQADFTENDKNNLSYIKNRPFYKSYGTIFSQEVTTTIEDEEFPVNMCEIDDIEKAEYGDIGDVYTVTFDGTKYVCDPLSEENWGLIGNMYIYFSAFKTYFETLYGSSFTDEEFAELLEMEIPNDTGEPFALVVDNNAVMIMTSEAGTYDVTIEGPLFIKLDERYMPEIEALPYVSTSDDGKILGVVDGEWTKTDAPSSLPEVTTDDNNKVLMVIDGVWTACAIVDGDEVAY